MFKTSIILNIWIKQIFIDKNKVFIKIFENQAAEDAWTADTV